MSRLLARGSSVRTSACTALGAVVLLASVAGCRSEPDFDDRYSTAEQQIRDKAREIDAELEQKPASDRQNDVETVQQDDNT